MIDQKNNKYKGIINTIKEMYCYEVSLLTLKLEVIISYSVDMGR